MRRPRRAFATRVALACCLAASLGGVEVAELPDGSPAKLTVLGNGAFLRGQYETAVSYYAKAHRADKAYFYSLFNLGLTHQKMAQAATSAEERQDHYTMARNYFRDAVDLRRDNPEVHASLGVIAFQLQEYALARTRFGNAVEAAIKPAEKAGYLYNLATAHEQLGDLSAARAAYEKCLALDERHFQAHYNLGTLHMRLKRPDLAESHLRRAHEADPRRPEPLLNLAVLAERGQGRGEAHALYTKAVQVATAHRPSMLTRALWHRARYYRRASIPGVPTKVLMKEDLQQILERDPDFAEANGLLGEYYESLAEYDKAIVHLEREIAGENFDPHSETDLRAHFRLAIIYSEHRRNEDKALEHVTAYSRLRPGAATALRERALRIFGDDEPSTTPEQPPSTESARDG